jgi:uncharacterized Zn finger protein (UPF0148 family)
MANEDINACVCGGKPLVRKMNSKKFNVLCPHCQRYYTRDKDTREEAIAAWNENIGLVKKSRKKVSNA